MVHIIKSYMSSHSLKLLASLLGEKIKKISVTTAGLPDKQNGSKHNMGFLVLLESNSKEVILFSTSIVTENGMEFPKLNVGYSWEYPDEDELLDERENIETALGYTWECKSLLSGCIIQDKVSWNVEGVNWEMEIEVGIKLKFDDVELLVMARDSSLGVLEIWIGKSQEWTNDTSRYKDVYSFDSSELKGIERVEVSF